MQETRPVPEVIPVRLGITTAFIVRQKGVILVDTGFPGSADTILRVMEQNTIAPRDVRLILLTHGHADHAGSAAELRARTGAGVAIHPADAEMLRCGDQGCLRPTSLLGRVLGPFFGGKKKSSFPSLDPDLVLREGMSLEPYGISGTVLCTPGHTPGSVSILLSSGDALAGDLLFAHPPSGRPGLPFWAEDVETAKMSIRTLLSYHPARIHIAHGAMVRGDAVKIP